MLIDYVQHLWTRGELIIGAVFSLFWTAFIWLVGGWDSQIQALR